MAIKIRKIPIATINNYRKMKQSLDMIIIILRQKTQTCKCIYQICTMKMALLKEMTRTTTRMFCKTWTILVIKLTILIKFLEAKLKSTEIPTSLLVNSNCEIMQSNKSLQHQIKIRELKIYGLQIIFKMTLIWLSNS